MKLRLSLQFSASTIWHALFTIIDRENSVYGHFSPVGLVLPVQSEIIQSWMIQSENDLVQDSLVLTTVQSRRHFSPDDLVHTTIQSQTFQSRMIQSKKIQSRTFQSRRLFSPEDILVQMIQSIGLFSPDNLVQMTVQSQTFQSHLIQSQPIQSKTFQSLTKNYDQLFLRSAISISYQNITVQNSPKH